MELTRKTILITGASSGLGRALAVELSKRDNAVWYTAWMMAWGVQEAVTRFGTLDVAIINAGGSSAQRMGTISAEEVLATMRTNFDTLVNFLCPLIDHMRERGGTIAYTGSPAGTFGLPKSGPYSAAKAAGRVLLDSCRIELAHTPIRFVALYPGFTYTEGLDTDEVPVKSLIIEKERAVREMLWAIERGRAHHMFPRRIRWPIALGRVVGEPVRRAILGLVDRPARGASRR